MMACHHKLKVLLLAGVLSMGAGGSGVTGVRAASPPEKKARIAQPPPPVAASGGIPDDVQLLNADANPTIRFPVGHSSLNWTLIKPRIKASYGWLEIDRGGVRYSLSRPSRAAKEADQSFEYSRGGITNITFEFSVAEFRAAGMRHFLGYSPQSHWDAADSTDPSVNSISKADGAYTPLILRALQNFDALVSELKLKQQNAAPPPPVVVQPAPPPAPRPATPPPAPTLVIVTPAGAAENRALEVSEPSLTIRGVAMDNEGLPTITINGTPAALRPKSGNVAEFWSDPITLARGDTLMEIVVTSPAQATVRYRFIARFTPKAPPVNPRALGKPDILSLLEGGVPASHVAELVRERGIKFTPTAEDLNAIRAAGATDELIDAIRQAAPPQ